MTLKSLWFTVVSLSTLCQSMKIIIFMASLSKSNHCLYTVETIDLTLPTPHHVE